VKASERQAEIEEFLKTNFEDFQGLVDKFKGKPQEALLQDAADDFEKYAASAGVVRQALEDREALMLHLRNIVETALNTARLELSEGKNPEDTVEKVRTVLYRAMPVKRAP
jgi:hypothetical protein